MRLASKLTSFFDRTIGSLAFLGCLVLGFTLLIVNYEVIARYLLNRPTAWMLEVVEYCLLYLCFLGTAWLLKEEGHLKMDIVLDRLSPRVQLWVNIATSIIGALVCLAVTWYGVKATWHLYLSGQYFAAYLKPPKYIIIAIVPIGCFLLSVQFLRRTYGFFKARGLRQMETRGYRCNQKLNR